MNFDFATALFLAALITGLIWLVDRLFLKPRRSVEGEADREPALVEYSRSFFPVILVVLILRSFIAEPFRIPSGSMLPTLIVGDFILVNKFAYGLRLPVVEKKVVDLGAPRHGDVVVFRYPPQPSVDYIKRVVGLPGDRITYRNKRLFLNGEPVLIAPYQVENGVNSGEGNDDGMLQFLETIGTAEHPIQIMRDRPAIDGEVIVPPGHYFVMGDNRDNSMDSRMWGFVPDENLLGKAFLIWMSFDFGSFEFFPDRIGNRIP